MASIKWSALVSEVKGVLNGSIMSNSSRGQTIRNRHAGGGRKTSLWGRSKVMLAYVSSTWRTLTPTQQLAWETMAVSYPYIDKFGNPQTPSGYQLYCTLNINLLLTNNLVDPTPHAPTAESNIAPFDFDNNAIGGFEMNFTPSAGAISIIMVYASAQLSAGVTRQPQAMRLISKVSDNTASPYTLTADYLRLFPPLQSGGRIFLKAEQIQIDIGQRYSTGVGSVIIP